MVGALAVPELHNVAEDADHQVVVFLFFIDLVLDDPHQPLLLGVQGQGVLDPAADDIGIEGPVDKVGGPQIVGAGHKGVVLGGGEHNDGDLVDPVEPLHGLQNLKAVHLRHGDVQQHQVHMGVLLQQQDRLAAILRLDKVVVLPQNVHEQGAVHLGVVHNQDGLFFSHKAAPLWMGQRLLPSSPAGRRARAGWEPIKFKQNCILP